MEQNHLKKMGLPVKLKQLESKKKWAPKNILKKMQNDKKKINSSLRFILCKNIGKTFIKDSVPEKLILQSIRDLIS